jgi:hypothetical protein
MTFRQNFFLQDWFRSKFGNWHRVRLGLGLVLVSQLVFGVGLVLVNRCFVTFSHSEASEIISPVIYDLIVYYRDKCTYLNYSTYSLFKTYCNRVENIV